VLLGICMVFYLMLNKSLSTEVGMPYLIGLITTYQAARVGGKGQGNTTTEVKTEKDEKGTTVTVDRTSDHN